MDLLFYPDPRLMQPAVEIGSIDDEVRARAQRMIEIMHEKKGVGLAANQVGWLARIIVVNPTAQRGTETVLINPTIEEKSGRRVGEEGCLSVPGVYADIERFERVVVRARDLEGIEFEVEATGLHAVVLQHEIDHLDGLLFLKRMSQADRARHRRRLAELDRAFKAVADA